MTPEEAKDIILGLLREKGKATNTAMVRAIGDDEALFGEIREELILEDLAADKDGVGLVFVESSRTDDDHAGGKARTPMKGEQGAAAPKARLFLSYGRLDASDLAERLRKDLQEHGYDVWQDTRQIRSGQDWAHVIEDGLRSTQLVVALLSPHAVRKTRDPKSPDDADSVCLDELSFARFAQPPTPIVPVMAVPCEPPFVLFRLDYVDLHEWKESDDQYQGGLQKLLESLELALQGQVRYRERERRLEPWDFAAFLNEKRKDFTGREWLFDEIDAWCRSSQDQALLITGDPGVGKSAIVAELVHQNPDGQVLAYHCCMADTRETLRPVRFVRSLAAMIASQLDGYAAKLQDSEVSDALSDASVNRDPGSAFEAGILTPLQSLPAPDGGVRYILVDALDEALLARDEGSGATIVDILASRLKRLPPWLRIVATTRKERPVLDRLRGLRAKELDAQDPRNIEDIDHYIARRLAEPNLAERRVAAGATAGRVQSVLRGKSEGNFLYVQQALEAVETDTASFERLDELPPGLYGLYLSFFERHFPTEAAYAPYRAILEAMVAAQAPLTREQLAAVVGLDAEEELPRRMRRLSSYLPERRGGDTVAYAVYHKSLADWLKDADQGSDVHFISHKKGHERLADLCWAEYQHYAETWPSDSHTPAPPPLRRFRSPTLPYSHTPILPLRLHTPPPPHPPHRL